MEREISRLSCYGRKFRSLRSRLEYIERVCKRLGLEFAAPRFKTYYRIENFAYSSYDDAGFGLTIMFAFMMAKYCGDECLIWAAKNFLGDKMFSRFLKDWIILNSRDEVAKKLGKSYFGDQEKDSWIAGPMKYYPGSRLVLWEAGYNDGNHDHLYYGVRKGNIFYVEYGEIDHNNLRPTRVERDDRFYYPADGVNGFFDRNGLN